MNKVPISGIDIKSIYNKEEIIFITDLKKGGFWIHLNDHLRTFSDNILSREPILPILIGPSLLKH